MDEIRERLEREKSDCIGRYVPSSTYCEHVSYLLELLETANEVIVEMKQAAGKNDEESTDHDKQEG